MSNGYSTDSAQHRANQRLRQQEHAHRTALIAAAAARAMNSESAARVQQVNNEIIGSL